MAKITIMKGLPASGKSTKAKEIVSQGNSVRMNKDLLREMLHFNKFTHQNEGVTQKAARGLTKMLLESGISVVIDDTNLNPSTVQSWKDLANETESKIEYVDMTNVPVNQCMIRDEDRARQTVPVRSVGSHVIQKMALQYLGYLKDRKSVICDIDGTLADCEHRKHFVSGETKDWKGFFEAMSEDTLRKHVWWKVVGDSAEKTAFIILVSARPETYRKETEEWLQKNGIFYSVLIMREAHDKRPDTMVKQEIYDKYLKDLEIVKVFDDRPSVIRMWRENGLIVEDVGNGEEF